MNRISTYIKQRVNILSWSVVALMLIAFSLKDFSISMFEIYSIPFVLFFLLIMRLFDDLKSAKIDQGKENRDYTKVTSTKKLFRIAISLQVLLIIMLSVFDFKRAMMLFVFLTFNHLLYTALFNVSKFRYFLPLLKYPFVVLILNMELSFNLLAVFGAFVVFEMLEDKSFPGYLFSVNKNSSFIKKYSSYLFLFLFLIIQLILIKL